MLLHKNQSQTAFLLAEIDSYSVSRGLKYIGVMLIVPRKQWYFVSKIVLTYCDKKSIYPGIEKNF